jgi:hypothetical protein
LKRITAQLPRAVSPLVSPLETAYEAARDAQSIVRDRQRREARSLHDYTGEDEDTKRTDVHVHVHQHPTPSQPEIEVETEVSVGPVKVTGLPRWAVGAIVATGIVVAAVTAAVAHFAK